MKKVKWELYGTDATGVVEIKDNATDAEIEKRVRDDIAGLILWNTVEE